ncbi:2-dehydropantoate 2-reductase [Halomonas shengliensis]|uniref:2-dehydropantoate 2-reductase n=1 Tax=Halomonas shengliensis TaxID=419597 RepID=A0A1H0LAX6_9GAMM|nr:2-dehydropantoate 2-reductase [Halomonas shengliensis]SDO65100.1 2-dehydropantoate 2-reductase [Halomonas shengliensis]
MAPAPHWIVGPGAIGRLLALRLASAGHEVVMIGRRPLPDHQTLITPEGDALAVKLPTRVAPPDEAPCVVHLTTKAYAAETAFAGLAARLDAASPLVLWQNGFTAQPRLTDRHPGPVLCATTTEGAFVEDDRRVVHAGHGETALGALDGRHTELAASLAVTLGAAGLPTSAVPDIRRRLWQKLAVNAAINPLVAYHRVRNGELRDPCYRDEVEAVIVEVAAVMAAEGVTPPQGDGLAGWRALIWKVVTATAGNRASMLQDVLADRPTEHEAILGPLLEAATRHGLATPVLAELARRLAETSPGC